MENYTEEEIKYILKQASKAMKAMVTSDRYLMVEGSQSVVDKAWEIADLMLKSRKKILGY